MSGYADPNTEVFQRRAELVKQENCRMQWHERWSWLLDEQRKTLEESQEIRKQLPKLPGDGERTEVTTTGPHPVPLTSNGVIGWLSTKEDCKLEIYTPWRQRVPIKKPDAWELPGYVRKADY